MNMLRAAAFVILIAATPLPALAQTVDFEGLKTLVSNMGYTPKPAGKAGELPQIEVSVASGKFDVPITLEINRSGRYIWARAFLGAKAVDGAKAVEMLKRNHVVQPSTFWIDASGRLMLGVPIENMSVTPAHMKFVLEKLAADVADTSDLWG